MIHLVSFLDAVLNAVCIPAIIVVSKTFWCQFNKTLVYIIAAKSCQLKVVTCPPFCVRCHNQTLLVYFSLSAASLNQILMKVLLLITTRGKIHPELGIQYSTKCTKSCTISTVSTSHSGWSQPYLLFVLKQHIILVIRGDIHGLVPSLLLLLHTSALTIYNALLKNIRKPRTMMYHRAPLFH